MNTSNSEESIALKLVQRRPFVKLSEILKQSASTVERSLTQSYKIYVALDTLEKNLYEISSSSPYYFETLHSHPHHHVK